MYTHIHTHTHTNKHLKRNKNYVIAKHKNWAIDKINMTWQYTVFISFVEEKEKLRNWKKNQCQNWERKNWSCIKYYIVVCLVWRVCIHVWEWKNSDPTATTTTTTRTQPRRQRQREKEKREEKQKKINSMNFNWIQLLIIIDIWRE